MIVGQKRILSRIDQMASVGFPRFTILIGPEGSGRKTISRYINKKLNADISYIGISADEVRGIVDNSYFVKSPIVYVIADADKMSVAAKNSLLKITEEPPNNAYFIMTITDREYTLRTLLSRANVLYMDPYTEEELREYVNMPNMFTTQDKMPISSEGWNTLYKISGNIGRLEEFRSSDFQKLLDFCWKVAENIHNVSGANALKIVNSLKLKDSDSTGFDVGMFLDVMTYLYNSEIEPKYEAALSVRATLRCKEDLRIKGINKQATMDAWIFRIREIWR